MERFSLKDLPFSHFAKETPSVSFPVSILPQMMGSMSWGGGGEGGMEGGRLAAKIALLLTAVVLTFNLGKIGGLGKPIFVL